MARLMNVGIALIFLCVFVSFCAESKPFYRWVKRWYFKRGGNSVNKAACLARLNAIRKDHGAPPMEWDSYVEKHATKWANHLAATHKVEHDPEEGMSDKEGENIYMSKSGSATCVEALNHWYSEYQTYKDSGACTSPPENGVPGTEEFTHMIWESSDKVAVVVVGNVVVARFFPPGNFEGDYEFDVKCKA